MSLHNLAKKVQSTGRGQDSMLVHMSPREVQGLQSLAQMKGGSLTRNPKTGLPEAGFLEDILPMVAAGAAIYFTAGAATPMLMSAGMGATSAGILAGAGAGAAIGAGSAAIQGKDVGNAALMGGVTGAIGGGIGAPSEGATVEQATQLGTNALNVNPSTGAVVDPLAGAGKTFSYTPSGEMVPSNYAPEITGAQTSAAPTPNPADVGKTANQLAGDRLQQEEAARVAAAQKDPNASWWSKQSATEKAGYSTLGAGLLAGLNAPPNNNGAPDDTYQSSLKRISPNFRAQEPIQPNPYYRAQYPVYAAGGGLMSAYQNGGPVERMTQMNTAMNPQGGLYPQGMIDKTQYATPTQRPTSLEVVESEPSYDARVNPITGTLMSGGGDVNKKKKQAADLTPESRIASYDPYNAGIAMANNARNQASLTNMQLPPAAMRTLGGVPVAAAGGLASLGGYSDGGRLLKGPGDGMSDNIPATIGRKQPARLADGEFVVPADVVSHLGNGSTDAGAKRLYAMMDKVRTARTGKKKQAPAVNTNKYLPA